MMYKLLKQKNRGFTLVETLVSISIFTISILGLLSVLSKGISDTTYAKKKIIAGYLAQEGIEYIRNMRDTFVIYDTTSSQNGWSLFNNKLFPSCLAANGGCYFGDLSASDFTNPSQPMTGITVASCGASCPQLFYTSGKYNNDISGSGSGFFRKITVNQVGIDVTKITSTVSWAQGSGNYNITFSENLFNWIQ